MKTLDIIKKREEATDELVNTIADNCCKVCACTNGKKVWCACHRKQIKSFNTQTIIAICEGEIERLEEKKAEMLGDAPHNILNNWENGSWETLCREISHYKQLIKELS